VEEGEAACRRGDHRLLCGQEPVGLVVDHVVGFRVCFLGVEDRSGVQVEGQVDLEEVAFRALATYALISTSRARSSSPILEAG
jgi:hypothetical protein